MRIFIQSVAFVSLFTLAVSCSKKASDTVAPEQCLYLGKTVIGERPSVNEKTSYGNEIDWNDQKQMTAARRFDKSEGRSNISDAILWTNDNQINFTFAYDSEGFLTQKVMKIINIHWGEGVRATTYEGRKFENFADETSETSEYKYESGRVKLVNILVAKRLRGNGEILLDQTFNYTKTYTYDSQGNPVSAIETNPLGKTVSTYKNGILASAVTTNTADQLQFTEEYDDKGNRTAQIGRNYRFNYTYDAKGNLTRIEYTVNNKPVYTQDYTFDDRLNPESTIPTKFKGIPELLRTLPISTSVNNITGKKYNGIQITSNYETKSSYVYNVDGLPESSASTWTGEEIGQTESTTFRYKCP